MKNPQHNANKRILLVGPLPPPIGGSGLTMMALIDELKKYPLINVKVINSSPFSDPKKKMGGIKFEKIIRMLNILSKYILQIRGADVVLVLANPLFVLTIVPLLLFFARLYHKPFYIKPVGGDLDIFFESHGLIIKKFMLWILRKSTGILSQTQLLQDVLIGLNCPKTHYLPGFRTVRDVDISKNGKFSEFRLVFIGNIVYEKGPIVLLEALQFLSQKTSFPVACDFFGLIHDEVKEKFFQQLRITPNANYCGMLAAGSAVELIAKYDALVLPTYFKSEGHPGVIIEAMLAGVPVISTQHRAIPELITNGENGILIPVSDSWALSEAILWAVQNQELFRKMGDNNKSRAKLFSSEVVVPQLLDIIF